MKLYDRRLAPTDRTGADRSSRAFFQRVLPAALEAKLAAFRQIGGSIGFYVGGEQWLIDLDACAVRGGQGWPAVEEAHLPSPVVRLEERSFTALSAGRSLDEVPGLIDGDLARLRRFLVVLASP